MASEYEELRIRLLKVGTGRYLIFANGLAAATAVIDLPDPQHFVEERNRLLGEEFGYDSPLTGATGDRRERLQALGEELFEVLFQQPIEECLRQSLLLAGTRPLRHLRLRFYLDDDLRDLPVEILRVPRRDPLGFLVLHPSTPDISIVRSLPGGTMPDERLLSAQEQRQRLRLLVVVAAPRGLELPQAQQEVVNVHDRLADLSFFVKIEVLANSVLVEGQEPEPVTRANLRERVEGLGQEPSAILIIAHGYFDEERKQGIVLLEDENGERDEVPGRDVLSGELANAPGLRLVILNLCRGTTTEPTQEVYAGVAQSMIAAGIPAVVAMQFDVGDSAACQFGPTCLNMIARNQPIDRAVRAGRRAIADQQESTTLDSAVWTNMQWCIPACFLHKDVGTGGWLCKVTEAYEGAAPPDPLAKGLEDLTAYKVNPNVKYAESAMRYCRLVNEWQEAKKVGASACGAASADEKLQRLCSEAQREELVEQITSICGMLCDEQNTHKAQSALRSIPKRIAGDFEALAEEVGQLAQLETWYQDALAHQQAGEWNLALQLYEGNKNGGSAQRLQTYKDVPDRTVYTRGRLLESEGEWQKAADVYGQFDREIYDVRARTAYCVGRCEEARRHWSDALNAYEHAQASSPAGNMLRDVEKRLEYCRCWVAVLDKLTQRQWPEASLELKKLRMLTPHDQAVPPWQQWCRDAPKIVPILEEKMAAGSLVRAPEVPWEGGDCPYIALAESSVTPASSLAVCRDDVDPSDLTGTQKKAWQTLSRIDDRLVVDFTLYTVGRPQEAKALVECLCSPDAEAGPMRLDEIADRLGQDAGVFWVLLREYGKALEFFRERAREQPEDVMLLHQLGLAAADKIYFAKRVGDDEQLEDWQLLILGWGPVFASDKFWRPWWSARNQVYGGNVSNEQIEEARSRIQRFWLEQFAANAASHAKLDVLLQAESAGARAVQDAGGIPAQNGAVLGLLGVRRLGLVDAVARWAQSLADQGWSAPGRKQLCRYLSEIAEAAALFEAGRFNEVIAMLTEPRCEHQRRGSAECGRPRPQPPEPFVAAARCHCFREANPILADLADGEKLLVTGACELLWQAHCQLARAAVAESPSDLVTTFAQWQKAMDVARWCGQPEAILIEVRKVAIGRAQQLCDRRDKEGRRDALDDAVELLEQVRRLDWDGPDEEIKTALVEALLDRAVFVSNEYDDERQARTDSQRALEMAPEYLRAIDCFCHASLHWAQAKLLEHENRAAEWLAEDVEKMLVKGELLYGSDDLASCRRHLEQLREDMDDINRPPVSIGPPPKLDQPSELLTVAIRKQSEGDFDGAVKGYLEILELDPAHHDARARLPWCYREWIHYLNNNGPHGQLVRVVREARKQCPQASALEDVFKEFEEI